MTAPAHLNRPRVHRVAKTMAPLPEAKPMPNVPVPPTANVWERENYGGAELRPFDGRPGCNDHMRYGSMVNGVVVPYTGPAPLCVGAQPASVAGGKQRRFAA